MTVAPSHTFAGPYGLDGRAPTGTANVVLHPVGSVYVTIAVPLDIPVSTPPKVVMVPTAVGAAVHAPPVGDEASGSVSPTQIALRPTMAPGAGLISRVAVA